MCHSLDPTRPVTWGMDNPDASNRLTFTTKGNAAHYKAACNGDATSLEPFTANTMSLFHGQPVVVLQSTGRAGESTLTVSDEQGHTTTITVVAR